mgnify:CR=1 FL=1
MGKAKILIVDDDLDFTKAVKVTLESEKYTVVTAGSRAEGMEKVRAERPDLIILDVVMGSWEEGFEMARELKKDSQFIRNIPILMLTSVKSKTGIDFKSTAGDPLWCPVDSFLDKPVEFNILLAEVRKLLQK